MQGERAVRTTVMPRKWLDLGGVLAGGAGGAVYSYAGEVVGFGSCGWGRRDFDIVGFEEVG